MAKVFLNGEILEAEQAEVSVSDSGFLYGMGLFETMRCSEGVVFALNEHIERLFGSAEALAINNPYDKKHITDAVNQTLRANGLEDARLRLTLTNGPMGDVNEKQATLLITATEFTPYPPEYYKTGTRVVLTEFRQNPFDPLSRHKTTNYFSRLLALEDARKKQAAEALWFTTDNRLAEGCVSNVFLVKDSVLCTPTLKTPVLPGITRKTVCKIAKSYSIKLIEQDLTINDLLAADEVFVTNVIMLALPVVAIESHTIGDGKPGPMTKKILNYLNEAVSPGK